MSIRTLQKDSNYVLPELKLRGLVPNFHIPIFIHLWAIYVFPGSVPLFCCSRSWEYLSRSQIYEWKNGDWGRAVSLLGIFLFGTVSLLCTKQKYKKRWYMLKHPPPPISSYCRQSLSLPHREERLQQRSRNHTDSKRHYWTGHRLIFFVRHAIMITETSKKEGKP